MQVQLPLDDIQATAVINQTIVPPPDMGVVSIILDVDVFRSVAVPQDESEIWSYFETLHIYKNKVFEASITNKTRELFQ